MKARVRARCTVCGRTVWALGTRRLILSLAQHLLTHVYSAEGPGGSP